MEEFITMLIKKKQEVEQMEQLKELAVGLELLAITSTLVAKGSSSGDTKDGKLSNQELSALRLPDFDTLSKLIGISSDTYTKVKNRWGPLTKFDFKSRYQKFGNHTKDFYGVVRTLSSGQKRLYLGQVDDPSSKTPFGMGVRICDDGEFEEGFWIDGKQHGYGRCIYPDLTVYEGRFKLNEKHGDGEDKYTNGSRFVGHFVNDSKDGDGAMHYKDGTVKRGLWVDGDLEREY